jgi:hypothetical protein
MTGHALFSPSKAHMWMECPGSFSYPENTTDDGESSPFADDGTASHTWASLALEKGWDAEEMIGATCELNGITYTMDEERAGFVQVYLDLVRQRAIGRELFIEHRVDLSAWLGPDQGGTADAVIIGAGVLTVIDLKYGQGEKVDASYCADSVMLPNHQLALYALGALQDAQLLGHHVSKARLIACQPRLHHIDEATFEVADLLEFAELAKAAAAQAGYAMVEKPEDATDLMVPGEKTCRWCKAKAKCPKLAAYVAQETKSDFETILTDAPAAPAAPADLSAAMIAVPLIEQWCSAVRAAVWQAVSDGVEVLGPDLLPMKFVEGKMGSRKWINPETAEAALVGQLGPKAYKPQEIITAPAAAKLLDKKATKSLWADQFEPLIHKPPGRPQLALGSDPRAPYVGVDTGDFDEIE